MKRPARQSVEHMAGTHRADEGLEDSGAGGVEDVGGLELVPKGLVVGGGAAGGARGVAAEGERPVERQWRP